LANVPPAFNHSVILFLSLAGNNPEGGIGVGTPSIALILILPFWDTIWQSSEKLIPLCALEPVWQPDTAQLFRITSLAAEKSGPGDPEQLLPPVGGGGGGGGGGLSPPPLLQENNKMKKREKRATAMASLFFITFYLNNRLKLKDYDGITFILFRKKTIRKLL
jgi:hypothetical protein